MTRGGAFASCQGCGSRWDETRYLDCDCGSIDLSKNSLPRYFSWRDYKLTFMPKITAFTWMLAVQWLALAMSAPTIKFPTKSVMVSGTRNRCVFFITARVLHILIGVADVWIFPGM